MFASCKCRFVPGPKWWTGVTGWTFGKGRGKTMAHAVGGQPHMENHGPPSHQDMEYTWNQWAFGIFLWSQLWMLRMVFCRSDVFFHAGTKHQTSCFVQLVAKEWNIMKNISTSCYSVLFFIKTLFECKSWVPKKVVFTLRSHSQRRPDLYKTAHNGSELEAASLWCPSYPAAGWAGLWAGGELILMGSRPGGLSHRQFG